MWKERDGPEIGPALAGVLSDAVLLQGDVVLVGPQDAARLDAHVAAFAVRKRGQIVLVEGDIGVDQARLPGALRGPPGVAYPPPRSLRCHSERR
jgi:hypothetical protein